MKKQNFDCGWLFHHGDIPEARWNKRIDASKFRAVNLPHDWSIELKPDPQSPCGASGGFFPTGIGWYAKSFHIPEELRGSKIFIEFEGIYMNSEIWINENYLGRHPYGYTSFYYDLTPYINYGKENDLRVLVDNSYQVNSRWYSGSGIYRHVWLMTANPLHISHWGTYIVTEEVGEKSAKVCVKTSVENETKEEQNIILRSRVISPDGSIAAVSDSQMVIGSGEAAQCIQNVNINSPLLWSVESPLLYKLESEIIVNGKIVDSDESTFGIRTLHFSAAGFLLNGKPLKLKGGCVHHDNGILGSASYDRAEERKIELLKANGFNSVRCAHNPPAPAFLNACDRLGMLVIDEAFDCWREGKNNGDYHASFDDWWSRDLDSMLLRDRNHPSIIMWSIGNELLERDGRSRGVEIARMLAEHVRNTDPSRPVTAAINGGDWPWENTDGIFSVLDVCGYNYQIDQYKKDHERHPSRIIYGSETTPQEAFQVWTDAINEDHVIGDFVWTSLDYLGEAGIGRMHFDGDKAGFCGDYPWNQANCGDIDVCGFKRPQSYYRDILWGIGSKLYIAVHKPVPEGKTPTVTYWGWPDVVPSWTWPGYENEIMKVDVYSAFEEVELFINGKSLGRKPASKQERFTATFDVPYEAGVLMAVGYAKGERTQTFELRTAGKPSAIRLTPDRCFLKAEYGDLSYVTVEIIDSQGIVCPCSDREIFFTIQGEGTIEAVGNSNPASSECYKGNHRMSYRGRCLVVIKSNGNPGEICLRAQADGLDAAQVAIQVR